MTQRPAAATGLFLAALLIISCGKGSVDKSTPGGFLAWSMNQYHDLHSFSAKCSWNLKSGPLTLHADRDISYQAPNLFSVVSNSSQGTKQTSVSDGATLVDISTARGASGQSYQAPTSIANAQSMQMQHPYFCGSLLYKFFAGGSQLDELADQTNGPITDGGEQTLPNGGKGKVIKFYATGYYGHTSALIDETTGMVQSITYDSEPLMTQVNSANSKKKPPTVSTMETYSEIKVNPTFSAETFKVEVPAGKKIDDMTAVNLSNEKPPVEFGSPAPDFTVEDLEGKKLKLSSLRGKPVFIDFWATWCGPCRMSLPHTQELSDKHGKEITVVTISDEDVDTIVNFRKEKNYTYPAYRDPTNKASELYNVEGIPTFVVIDDKGNLVGYVTGYDNDAVKRALKKVGIEA